MNMSERTRGVALLLIFHGKLWVVEECEEKVRFGKRIGDWSVPMETLESGEDDHAALDRLLQQEVPRGTKIDRGFGFDPLIHVDILGNAQVNAYTAFFRSADDLLIPEPFRSEIRAIGWKTVDEILSHRCREGVWSMLKAYHTWCRQEFDRPDMSFAF